MEKGNLVFLLLVLLSYAGLYKIFEKKGVPGWKGIVPFYNYYEWLKLLEKPWWWVFLMIVPGVNIIMYGVLGYHTALYFGKRKTSDLVAAALMPYLYVVYLGFGKDEKWVGIADLKHKKGGFVKNWLDPLLFAVVAATVIRTFFLEAFTIPTSSLEKSLMVGDFLFVNKFAYGPKIPQTPLAFPFAHHTMPFTKDTKSYLEWLKLPYMRIPGYSKVKNYDIVVFNYPDGDTVALGAQNQSYYQLVRTMATIYRQQDMRNGDPLKTDAQYYNMGWNYVNTPDNRNPYSGEPFGNVTARPVDKREHYVKRCVAIAGDKLEVRDGDVYINDKKMPMPENAQHHYFVKFYGSMVNEAFLDKWDIYVDEASVLTATVVSPEATEVKWRTFTKPAIEEPYDGDEQKAYNMIRNLDTSYYKLNLTAAKAEEIKKLPGCISVELQIDKKGDYQENIFPHKSTYPWNNDNFGPLQIPKAGQTIAIDTSNICLYDRLIGVYDGNKLEVKNGKIFINDVESRQYTFKQDYYFMMGDNRHNSADSRSWGMVPFDHVVGKPVFVWFSMKDPEKNPISGKSILGSLTKNSTEGKFRWNRFFSYVDDKGLHSWFWQTIVVIVLLIFGPKIWRRYRAKKSTA